MRDREKITVILLAGGVGSRMNADIPKQFMQLKEKPIALHSFELFASLPEVQEIIVVCAEKYRHHFTLPNSSIALTFAPPGARRQDSVYNGLQAMTISAPYICVHDSARPFIDAALIRIVVDAAILHGAAALGMPVKFTVKEVDAQGFVIHTPNRSRIWEVQTPQVLRRDLLEKGFSNAMQSNLDVTDDVSLVERLGLTVQLVEGSYSNIKITTREDLITAEAYLALA